MAMEAEVAALSLADKIREMAVQVEEEDGRGELVSYISALFSITSITLPAVTDA